MKDIIKIFTATFDVTDYSHAAILQGQCDRWMEEDKISTIQSTSITLQKNAVILVVVGKQWETKPDIGV